MLAFANVGNWFATVLATTKQFYFQVRIRLISQLIGGISRVLQKLLRHFDGTIISTSFMSLISLFFKT